MRWLKHTTSLLLIVAVAAVALATAFSEHSDDYGRVGLPQGGTVDLPKGTVTVFFKELGQQDPIRQLDAPLSFQVVPASGGQPLEEAPTAGGTSEVEVQRSEQIGSLGSVAKVEVPEAGLYTVSGSATGSAGSSFLTFGTDAGTAVFHKWKLLAGLLGGAMLLTLIPTPRPSKRWEDGAGPSGWSSDSTSPYTAGPPPGGQTPYAG
jgi:hypothetical protein